ncbi:hypothetical protein [Paenibacillus validus]|uniref:hypothetical protein n=1 Tax=Paenibacillus validus TaxID=44253 RepID=UPI003D29462E
MTLKRREAESEKVRSFCYDKQDTKKKLQVGAMKQHRMTLPIRIKLLASFLVISAMLGVAGSIAYVYMQIVDRSYSDLVNRRASILLYSERNAGSGDPNE